MNLITVGGIIADATLLDYRYRPFPKSINDTWGHEMGDEATGALTRTVTKLPLRGKRMLIGRFGGDEFAAITSGVRQPESAITAMLRVHEGLNTLRLPITPQVTFTD